MKSWRMILRHGYQGTRWNHATIMDRWRSFVRRDSIMTERSMRWYGTDRRLLSACTVKGTGCGWYRLTQIMRTYLLRMRKKPRVVRNDCWKLYAVGGIKMGCFDYSKEPRSDIAFVDMKSFYASVECVARGCIH